MSQKTIGTRIAELRKEKGYTQNEVVEMCNINIRTLQRIESNQVQPRMYTVRKLLGAMGYEMDDLKEDTKSDKQKHSLHMATIVFDKTAKVLNQNKSMMKKTALVLTAVVAVVFVTNVATTYKVEDQKAKPEQSLLFWKDAKPEKEKKLIKGVWQLVQSNDYKVDKFNKRIMTFKPNGKFITKNANGTPFNSGKYYFTDDNKLITIHYNEKSELRETCNYYNFSVSKDKLIIKGIYLRPLMNNHYETFRVDEVWKKVAE